MTVTCPNFSPTLGKLYKSEYVGVSGRAVFRKSPMQCVSVFSHTPLCISVRNAFLTLGVIFVNAFLTLGVIFVMYLVFLNWLLIIYLCNWDDTILPDK